MPSQSFLVFYSVCTVLLILACMIAGCSSSQAPVTAVPTQSNVEGGTGITIKNFAFDPQMLTVKPGTVVTWVNQDAVPHAIVSDTESPETFSSDTLQTGSSYSFTFTRPGTFPYHCSIHPSMKGTVIVQP
jgi:plastocyanin